MPQDPPQLDQIAQALSAFQQAGKPPDLLPKVQQFVQTRYDQLGQGGFWKDPNNAGIGHSLRSTGYVSDPTQGGAVSAPGAAPSLSALGDWQRRAVCRSTRACLRPIPRRVPGEPGGRHLWQGLP